MKAPRLVQLGEINRGPQQVKSQAGPGRALWERDSDMVSYQFCGRWQKVPLFGCSPSGGLSSTCRELWYT